MAATDQEGILDLSEVDLITGYGNDTITDFQGTLKWMRDNLAGLESIYVVSSQGHSRRLVAGIEAHGPFPHSIKHIESGERITAEQMESDFLRVAEIPPHQFLQGGRASDVARFSSRDALAWENNMRSWAQDNPEDFETYLSSLWNLVGRCEERNIIIKIAGAGWQLSVNCV
jgi:hypothetical protein